MSAFAFNVPVLATDVGGLSEYVEHKKSGFIVSPKDINGLVQGINYLLDNRWELNVQRDYICKKYTTGEYSWKNITDDLIKFYRN
jgi:glycosyltransferase involved in cell wall biosynthesis